MKKTQTLLILLFSVFAIFSVETNAQTCTGANCTGLAASSAGCDTNVSTLRFSSIQDDSYNILGFLTLYYSARCETVWSVVSAGYDNSLSSASVTFNGYVLTGNGGNTADSGMIYVGSSRPTGTSAEGSVGATFISVNDCPPAPQQCNPSYHLGAAQVFY